jgi:hypothetical protein
MIVGVRGPGFNSRIGPVYFVNVMKTLVNNVTIAYQFC